LSYMVINGLKKPCLTIMKKFYATLVKQTNGFRIYVNYFLILQTAK
jgi:hypothetical protein